MGFRQYLPLTLGKPIFFVSLDGSDVNGDGTFENPWRTIGKGVSLLSGWDTLYIRGGTYVEQVTISRSGTADAPITIAAYPGEKVVIDGRAGVDGLNEGLPEDGELILPSESRFGTGYRYTALVSIEANYITFEGIEITRSMGRGVRVWRSGRNTRGVTIRNCEISYSREAGLLLEENCMEITIEDCDIYQNSNFAPYPRFPTVLDWTAGLAVKASQKISITGTHVHENWGEGILADTQVNGTKDVSISDCVLYDNMSPNIYLHAVQDVVVSGNLLYQTDNSEFPNAAGIALSPAEPQFTQDLPTQNVNIVNNIIVGFSSNIAFYSSAERSLENIRIYYNTLVNAVDQGIHETKASFQGCEFRNNLSFQSNGAPHTNNGGSFVNWTFSNNAWTIPPPSDIGNSSDIVGNLQLENPDSKRERGKVDPAWYKIKSSSSVIGQANESLPVNQDFFHNSRDAQPDIGAHEFQKETFATNTINTSTGSESKPIFYDRTVVDLLSSSGFRRFIIVSNKAVARPDKIIGFGIQFPDQQCLIYGGNQANSPLIFEDVSQALEEYKKLDVMLNWMD